MCGVDMSSMNMSIKY